jgi:hypothetical protein
MDKVAQETGSNAMRINFFFSDRDHRTHSAGNLREHPRARPRRRLAKNGPQFTGVPSHTGGGFEVNFSASLHAG